MQRLTLVSAPAGFGKTTLLAEWLVAPPAEHHADAHQDIYTKLGVNNRRAAVLRAQELDFLAPARKH